MTILHPWALLGLGAALVPLLLHLIARRQPPERTFPAVRYLEAATRAERHRLTLRHLLLLLLRTTIILCVVLAAADIRLDRAMPFGRHAPVAQVMILDNSASSGAMLDGEATLESLRRTAHDLLARATDQDRLWLMLADGIARPGTRSELADRLAAVRVLPVRFDLADAVRRADEILGSVDRAGEVVVVTDGQRSAMGPSAPGHHLVLLRPTGPPPVNRALRALTARDAPWGGDGGVLTLAVTGPDSLPVSTTVLVGHSPPRDLTVMPGVPSSLRVTPRTTGWQRLQAVLAADEFRLDDTAESGVEVTAATAVTWPADNRYLDAAVRVLLTERRLREARGGENAVHLGDLGPGPALVVPPEDPARLGALNRALAARGIEWQYGPVQVAQALTDSTAILPERIEVTRRATLRPTAPTRGTAVDTLITVGGTPWLVRIDNLLLLGSRLDPEWTALPLRTSFVPLLDGMITRLLRGAPLQSEAFVGDEVVLPPHITQILGMGGGEARPVAGRWTPAAVGGYWLVAGVDTVAALGVMIDPRESQLERATADEITAAWPGAVVAELGEGAARVFTVGGRGELRPLLLLLALLALAAESLVAGRLGRVR